MMAGILVSNLLRVKNSFMVLVLVLVLGLRSHELNYLLVGDLVCIAFFIALILILAGKEKRGKKVSLSKQGSPHDPIDDILIVITICQTRPCP